MGNATTMPEYNTWESMKNRCYNPNYHEYNYYGGRGIKVCKEWRKSFFNFLIDMDFCPSTNHSINRIDNGKDYCSENCEWATPKKQSNNKRNNVLIKYRGEVQTVAQWADEYNLVYGCLYARLERGWDIQEALTASVDKFHTKPRKTKRR